MRQNRSTRSLNRRHTLSAHAGDLLRRAVGGVQEAHVHNVWTCADPHKWGTLRSESEKNEDERSRNRMLLLLGDWQCWDVPGNIYEGVPSDVT